MKAKLTFFILLIFSGFIFYVGWTQIKIKPNSCGIVQSKIKGTSEELVIPGNYSWHWDFLIPTNAKLITFEMIPFNTNKSISGNFQSYDVNGTYCDYLNYYFNYSISISYTPEALLNLYKENFISNNEDLNAYLSNAADYMAQMASNYYLKRSSEDSSFNPQAVKRDELMAAISSYRDFPYLDIVIFSLTDFKLPNYNLYNKQKYQLDFNAKNESTTINSDISSNTLTEEEL